MLKTVRLLFAKQGRAKYTSHLDLNRMMTRAVRRAGIPLWYTEGFNRHPYLTFASPLSLGFESEGEILELRLVEDMPFEEVTARMNAALPEGFRVLETFEAEHKVRDLQLAGYRMEIAASEKTVAELLAQAEILVEKRTKKKTMKTIDIRPAFEKAVVTPTAEGCCVEVVLPVSSENTVNPTLLITALTAKTGESVAFSVTRTGLYLADGKDFK